MRKWKRGTQASQLAGPGEPRENHGKTLHKCQKIAISDISIMSFAI
jgi:hypothetical protein